MDVFVRKKIFENYFGGKKLYYFGVKIKAKDNDTRPGRATGPKKCHVQMF